MANEETERHTPSKGRDTPMGQPRWKCHTELCDKEMVYWTVYCQEVYIYYKIDRQDGLSIPSSILL